MALGQEGSLPFIAPDYSHNMVTDADHTAGTPVPAQYALELFDHDSDGADDYRKKYYITRNQLIQDASWSSLVKYVDFEVECDGVRYPVDWVDVGTKTYLEFDTLAPVANVKSWQDQDWLHHGQGHRTFTTQQLKIHPSEVLSTHSGTVENIIYIDDVARDNYYFCCYWIVFDMELSRLIYK